MAIAALHAERKHAMVSDYGRKNQPLRINRDDQSWLPSLPLTLPTKQSG
tara:strand:- start:132 stop:278 length:147 start_codon:yes stop_codon:yes gene_type:complete